MSMEDTHYELGRKRYLVTRGAANFKPFMPGGFLPALGLFALFLYALFVFSFSSIQAEARASAEDALAAIGADWANVAASGQVITLEGSAPSQADINAAERAIKEATRTPLGIRARPVINVRNRAKIAASNVAPAPAETPPPAITAHDWTYTLDRNVLVLSGDVPDNATQAAIINAAQRRQSTPRFSSVRNDLNITGHQAGNGFTETAIRGVNTLSRCDVGTASFTNNVFALNCEADPAIADAIQADASAPLEFGSLGRVDVYSAQDVVACNQTMMDLLSQTRIEFAISSAVIDAKSYTLLDQTAEAAKACPGRLQIEGHTDNTGRFSSNERLSRQRAEAVRRALIDRGVASARLSAEGYASSRPIADNTTERGRARNRRIEIKVAQGSN